MKARTRPRIVVLCNRDFEGAEEDPENKAREDVKEIADHIVRILSANGYEASGLGVTSDVAGALSELRARKPAAVFNLCESIHGDNRFESLLPLLLELERIPYTGSEPFALSLALRKEKVKEILRARGVPVPPGCLVSAQSEVARCEPALSVIVKPAREDASVGITRASVVNDWAALEARVLPHPRPLPSACPGRGVHRGARDLRVPTGPGWRRTPGLPVLRDSTSRPCRPTDPSRVV